MAITITWVDGTDAPVVLTINDEARESLEKYRLSMTTITPKGVPAPIYATVLDMILSMLGSVVITPALTQFPSAQVLTASKAAEAAQQVLRETQQRVMDSAITPTMRKKPDEQPKPAEPNNPPQPH